MRIETVLQLHYLPSSIADILIIIKNPFLVDTMNYLQQLNESGTLVALLHMYLFIYTVMVVVLLVRYFINHLLDAVIEHLLTEYEKNWCWEEPTHYRNGLDYLPNLLLSLDRITKEAEDGLAKLRKREAEHKKRMERQAEKIRLNKIKHKQYIDYRREHPFTEEEKKRELKSILDEMHKKYGHLFDDENPL